MIIKPESDKKGDERDENDYCYDDNNTYHVNDRHLSTVWYFSHRETQRYYVLLIQKDLFETIVVTKVWGSKLRKGNRMVHMPFINKAQALAYVDKIIKLRKGRGYELAANGK